MLRRLLTPRWLGALLLAVLYALAAYHLGHWQYSRHVAKVERNERISAHYSAQPVALDSVLTASPLPIEQEWIRVSARGSYSQQQLVARGRTFDGDVGFEVLAPFQLDTGSVVLIDRGWIPLGDKGAADVPAYAAAPVGEVTVTGWVRPGEKSRGKASTPGQIASISLADASAALGTPLLGGYVQLQEDSSPGSATAPEPIPLGKPDRSLGAHQAYAYQWWMTMPLGLVLMFFGLRREVATAGATATTAAVASAGRPPRPPKPKKTRIWDEEDA